MASILYICCQDDFEKFVEESVGCHLLALDTEFLRENTYHPRLCLLQLATENDVALIDPFEIDDLAPLSRLLTDESMMKIVHSGRQDIEILYTELGVMPWPIFDTQIAATLLGYTQQIGYGPLVQAECGVTLQKLDSFTDWSKRPLVKSQLEYAADDVVYLPRVYRSMRDRLEQKGRLSWLEGDFRALVDPKRYEANPYERYLHLKKVNQLNRRQLSAARELAAWREKRAEELDIPRKRVMTDEQVVEACRREARTIDQLFMVRGMHERLSTSSARQVVKCIATGLDAANDTWPQLRHAPKSQRNVDAEVDLMTALARKRAKEYGVAFQTLVSHEDLRALARGQQEGVAVLEGWRYDMIGRELLDLLDGKISLSISNHHLKVKSTKITS